MGVCYWDTRIPNGDAYGVHAARLATGLSYVDALDPSSDAVKKALAARRVDAQRVTALTEVLLAHWTELRAFAGPGF